MINLSDLKKFIDEACDKLEQAGFPLNEVDVCLDYEESLTDIKISELNLSNISIVSHDDTDGMPYLSIEVIKKNN